jgi:muconate cycloisomerase/chloromuconate cycloisomerase
VITTTTVIGREIAFADEFPTSYDDHGPTHHVFVRIEDDDGTVGYGEGSALKWFTGETSATMEAVAEETLLPAVDGLPADRALGEFRELARRFPGQPGAKAGVEMALLDLRAKQQGVPVRELLGPVRRTEVPLAFASGALPASDVAQNAGEAYDEGYRTFKIKADGELEGDAARINAVTRELDDRADADDVHVRVDANTGWDSYERAASVIERMDRKEFIEYFEQPVATDAVGDLRALRTSLGVPVFADEAVHGVPEVRSLTEGTPAISGFCAKLAKAGSLFDIVRMGELARDTEVPVTLVSAFETSLGVAANLHLAAVLPTLSSAAELGATLIAEDPVDEPLDQQPITPVPEGPGIGVELDDGLFE